MRWALIHGNRVETFGSWAEAIWAAVHREIAGQVLKTEHGWQPDLGVWDEIRTPMFLPGVRLVMRRA